jgi:hypothetical protein
LRLQHKTLQSVLHRGDESDAQHFRDLPAARTQQNPQVRERDRQTETESE